MQPACAGVPGRYTLRVSWKILITARTLDEVGKGAVELLRQAGCELVIPPKYGPHTADSLLTLLPGNDAVFASMDKFTADVLGSPAASRLKAISRWGGIKSGQGMNLAGIGIR